MYIFFPLGCAVLFAMMYIFMGVFLKRKPPKEISIFHGYRTPRSVSHPLLWKEGNALFAVLIQKAGWYVLVGGVLLSVLLPDHLVSFFIVLAIASLLPAFCAFSVEKHLKKIAKRENI
ncbi:hypothetical protein A374_15524 [Fictibacillus macauensis ZFHKF-1]|uniref:SdpI/YhfL protein family n=1 Tax=Fictibacillus macauensis ZFHKF-1 TaxID=1196324 RepID=I8AFL6_9BACL|nr:SdpI family protein [Fictibacillus macauensis]EIT84427.1 hypothetical protein A374_15524 [Fictibacillus macauensis ZFHKF-1]